MELREKLDRISELAWKTRGDWTNPKNDMKEICHLVEEIEQELIEQEYEPVELEMDKEIMDIVRGRLLSLENLAWYRRYDWSGRDEVVAGHLEYIIRDLRDTIAKNQGQLYRRKEVT